jgi:hypothetical protein
VWGGGDRVGTLSDAPDDVALQHGAAADDVRRAELEQRDCKAVGGLDRHRSAAARDRPDERDDAACGRVHGCAHFGTHVDAAVLTGRVRIQAEGVGPQDRAVDGPGPAGRRRDEEQGRDRECDRGGERTPHWTPPSCVGGQLRPR